MNDDVKKVNQNTSPTVPADQSQPQVQPVAPSAPTGSVNKEVGPIASPVSEFLKPTDVEPQIDKDIAELGVEAKKDEPNITDEHKGIIEHAKQYSPISSTSTGKVIMPMSEEEIADKLKTGQDDDSGKWLASLIQKIIKVIGF